MQHQKTVSHSNTCSSIRLHLLEHMFYFCGKLFLGNNPGQTRRGQSLGKDTLMNLVSVRQAQERMEISSRLIGKMMQDGRLTKYKLDGGQLVRIDLDELQALFVPQK